MILALAAGCPTEQRDLEKAQKRIDLAVEYLQKGEVAAAETEANKALAFDRENEEAHRVLGLIYFKGRAQPTIALIERADCLTGVEADALRAEADQHMRTAEKHFQKAVQLAPDYGEAWQDLSAVAIYWQDWDKAVEYADRALAQLARLQSEKLARANRGWALFKKQEYVKAVTDLRQATEGAQHQCLAEYRLAEVLFDRGEFASALEHVQPQLDDGKLCPPHIDLQHLVGQLRLRLHDGEGARAAFTACVTMAPKSCLAQQCEKALAALNP